MHIEYENISEKREIEINYAYIHTKKPDPGHKMRKIVIGKVGIIQITVTGLERDWMKKNLFHKHLSELRRVNVLHTAKTFWNNFLKIDFLHADLIILFVLYLRILLFTNIVHTAVVKQEI